MMQDQAPDTMSQAFADRDEQERAIAQYLVEHPDFFLRHAEVLRHARLRDPSNGRTLSLHARQLEVLRARERQLERRLDALVATGRANDLLAERLQRFVQALLRAPAPCDLPSSVVSGLREVFDVPFVGLRLWPLPAVLEGKPWGTGLSSGLIARVEELREPYCGLCEDDTPLHWFDDDGAPATQARAVRSVSLIPLSHAAGQRFGALLLGSPDPDRFQAGMATDVLVRIGHTVVAALTRLSPPPAREQIAAALGSRPDDNPFPEDVATRDLESGGARAGAA